MSDKTEKKTLSDDEMVTEAHMGRRSALGLIGAGVVGAAVAGAITAKPSQAHAQGPSDSDSGANADRPGHGRTGATDRDSGANADGPGRGVCRLRRHTDSDTGNNADGVNRGRGPCHQ
ncbi:MAG: hypothetical protein R3A48_02715 [Polyangiales bacterium]